MTGAKKSPRNVCPSRHLKASKTGSIQLADAEERTADALKMEESGAFAALGAV
jgi:hypothetical protein